MKESVSPLSLPKNAGPLAAAFVSNPECWNLQTDEGPQWQCSCPDPMACPFSVQHYLPPSLCLSAYINNASTHPIFAN